MVLSFYTELSEVSLGLYSALVCILGFIRWGIWDDERSLS